MGFYHHIASNPLESLLDYAAIVEVVDKRKKKQMLLSWMLSQTPGEREMVERAYERLERHFAVEVDFLATLFKEIGWLPHHISNVILEKLLFLENHDILEKDRVNYSFTTLGRQLYDSEYYLEYCRGISGKAQFWNDANVKIFIGDDIGSGFFVTPDLIVTCNHVVDGDANQCKIEGEDGTRYTVKKIVRHENKAVDLAVVEVKEQYQNHPMILAHESKIAERVFSFGYPPIPCSSEPFLVCNVGEINAQISNYLDKIFYLILSFIAKPGHSGGPILNEYGKVVGVISRNLQQKISSDHLQNAAGVDVAKALGYSAGIPSGYLIQLLDDYPNTGKTVYSSATD